MHGNFYPAQLEAAHQSGEDITVRQWAEAAYLLYQSPSIPHDIDWRAYTKGQETLVDGVHAKSQGDSIGNSQPFIDAIVPPVGFLLSTLVMKQIRKMWQQ